MNERDNEIDNATFISQFWPRIKTSSIYNRQREKRPENIVTWGRKNTRVENLNRLLVLIQILCWFTAWIEIVRWEVVIAANHSGRRPRIAMKGILMHGLCIARSHMGSQWHQNCRLTLSWDLIEREEKRAAAVIKWRSDTTHSTLPQRAVNV